jgi:hypothetical protein
VSLHRLLCCRSSGEIASLEAISRSHEEGDSTARPNGRRCRRRGAAGTGFNTDANSLAVAPVSLEKKDVS